MNEVYIDIRKENEWIRKYFNTDFVSIDNLLSIIEDLDTEIGMLKEKLNESKEEYDNYDDYLEYKKYYIEEEL